MCINAFWRLGLTIDMNPIKINGNPINAGMKEVMEELPESSDIENPQATKKRPYNILKNSTDKEKTLNSSVLFIFSCIYVPPACFFKSSILQISKHLIFVASRTTIGAFPACLASSHLAAHKHH